MERTCLTFQAGSKLLVPGVEICRKAKDDYMRFYRNKFKYAKRRVLIAAESIKRDRFLEACLEGDKNLFEELKKFRGAPQKVASKIDGHTDPVSITDHLKNIYQGLYNRTGSKVPLENLLHEVNEAVSNQDILDVQKVTPELIQKIIKEKIKPDKSDPEFDITTEQRRTNQKRNQRRNL